MPVAFVPSSNVARIRESATIAVSQRARALRAQGRTVIDLGAGEPDFDTPEFIRRAAQAALDQGATKYTAVEGIPPLRQAIADHTNGYAGAAGPVRPEEVIVTVGSKQALFNTCFALFDEGDEVLVPTPAWTSYYEMVELARATCVDVVGDPDHGFKVTAAMLAEAATPRTAGIMLNSPSNPTGAVYTADELREIVALAEARGWWLISDEIYRRISYDGDATSVLQVAGSRDRLVVIDGVAKAYAMTGWRIGWSIAPRELTRAMAALQSHSTSNATTVAQHGALAALTRREEAEREIARMVAEYRRRRDAAVEVLARAPGLRVVRPDGAFYLYVDVGATAPDSADAGTAFAAQLLDDFGVAVVPGAAFRTPAWIRMSYAAKTSDVVDGARAVVDLWSKLARR
jgi:aspartate aminotransferase